MRCIRVMMLLFAAVSLALAQNERLEKSPRHQEWAQVKNEDRTIHTFVVYPQKKEKATAVIVIHENKGLTDWVRSVADQLAEAGYIAAAPDFLSGAGPNGGKTSDFLSVDAATEALYKLTPEQVMSDLNAVSDYVLKLPASNGELTVGGFCWGGGNTLRFATKRADLKAVFPFYGSYPFTKEELANIKAPVYGFYGSNDARINASIPELEKLMKELGKKYEPVIYEGADHAYMRKAEDADGSVANKDAAAKSWERWKKLLQSL